MLTDIFLLINAKAMSLLQSLLSIVKGNENRESYIMNIEYSIDSCTGFCLSMNFLS